MNDYSWLYEALAVLNVVRASAGLGTGTSGRRACGIPASNFHCETGSKYYSRAYIKLGNREGAFIEFGTWLYMLPTSTAWPLARPLRLWYQSSGITSEENRLADVREPWKTLNEAVNTHYNHLVRFIIVS